MLGLKKYHRAAKQRQWQQQAGVTGPQRSQQPQKSRVQFNQLMPDIERKVNEHIFFYPPAMIEGNRKAEDWVSEATSRFGQALQRLHVAQAKEAEFLGQAQEREASNHPLTSQETEVFHAKLALCSKAVADSLTFIKEFKAQQNGFRDGQPSQPCTQACHNARDQKHDLSTSPPGRQTPESPRLWTSRSKNGQCFRIISRPHLSPYDVSSSTPSNTWSFTAVTCSISQELRS